MAHEEAAFSRQHSAVSENQNQHQRFSTTEDTEATHPEPKSGSLGAPDTEGGKTLPLSHGKPEQANADEQERVRQRAEAMVRRIGETCDELDKLVEENPELVGRVTRSTEEHKDAYLRLKARLALADMAPRCQWVRQDGTSCGSPQMKQHIYCFAHMQMAEARTLMLMLPVAEDANAIQIGLMQIQKALIEDRISMKKAGLLLYSMQLALTNVGQTTFGQAKDEEMVRETVDEEEALSRQRSTLSQEQTFETQRNGGSGGEEGLPRMDADKRGSENPKPIVWKPTPDMYRMDTKEGRAAYEASFGTKIKGPKINETKIKPRVAGERRPLQEFAQPGAAVLQDVQTHAVLG